MVAGVYNHSIYSLFFALLVTSFKCDSPPPDTNLGRAQVDASAFIGKFNGMVLNLTSSPEGPSVKLGLKIVVPSQNLTRPSLLSSLYERFIAVSFGEAKVELSGDGTFFGSM